MVIAGVMELNEADGETSRQIRVRFTTKLLPPLKVPKTSIAVPSNLTRMGLSEVVNHLLKNCVPDWQPQPFDFLINGELVRMSLEQFLLVKGISAEKILEIEYLKAVAPRKHEPYLHDDWVSAIDGGNSCFFATGCYDGFARLWNPIGTCTHILEGHSGAITSVHIINAKGDRSANGFCLATASKDRTLRLWKFELDEDLKKTKRIGTSKILTGHTSSVQSVSSDPSGDMLCSGSWDNCIKLWQISGSGTEGSQVSMKKRKLGDDMSSQEESHVEGGAVSTLVGHTQCVSSVVWPDARTIYSASWDHSVKTWDVETSKDYLNLVCAKALNCLDVGGESSALIASGGSDPVLRIWDPRKPGSLAPVFQFTSHSSWITACKWHGSSWFHLVSSSYDGKVMLWDLRTAWPVAIIDSHTDKVLCADWWKSESVISGGADSKAFVSSGISIY